MRDNRIVIVALVVLVLVGGVVFVFFGGRNNTETQTVSTVPDGNSVEETAPVIQETTVVAAPATNTVESEPMVPTPRASMVATDPGSVNLVSGNVQFVEAFAFW